MIDLVIQLHACTDPEDCALCGEPVQPAGGPHLARAEDREGVCRDCGKKHAPSLVALLDLAGTAQRTGRAVRHNVFPPLTTLLELARAAENYTSASPQALRRVA